MLHLEAEWPSKQRTLSVRIELFTGRNTHA